jgi:uncharacterized membrane protein YeaQ/YmgE (transglycosylase-associated protein family)
MLMFIIVLIVVGLFAGFVARLLVPGPDPMSLWATIGLGVLGSFAGGFFGWAVFGQNVEDGAIQPSGLIGSILGGIVLLLVYRAIDGNPRRI